MGLRLGLRYSLLLMVIGFSLWIFNFYGKLPQRDDFAEGLVRVKNNDHEPIARDNAKPEVDVINVENQAGDREVGKGDDEKQLQEKNEPGESIEDEEKQAEQKVQTEKPVDSRIQKIIELYKGENAYEAPLRNDPNAPGEMGKPYSMKNLTSEQEAQVKQGWQRNGFNQFISDQISLQRTLPDIRWPECKNKTYPYDLPEVSVIIPFRDEAWSTLLRTVHSVINRTPPHILKEIILSDDASELEHLKKPLEDYLSNLPIVRLVRLKERGGLIRTRLTGYNISSAPVVIFIDSHCEVTKGWIEPMVARIATDDRVVVTSIMDVIEGTDFRYRAYDIDTSAPIGSFDWSLLFKWERKAYTGDRSQPLASPTLIGCLIGISRRFFNELGTFDEGYFIWGAENLEISFKAWMCGGRVEQVPCSHVGHVYKGRLPYDWGKKKKSNEVIARNLQRLGAVWMDDYLEYHKQLSHVKNVDIGDISDRLAIRKKLNCKSFEWYIENIKPDLFIPGECQAHGTISSKDDSRICIDMGDDESTFDKSSVLAYPCHGMSTQIWYMCKHGTIRRNRGCLKPHEKSSMTQIICGDRESPLTSWQYREDNTLYHVGSGRCIELNKTGQNNAVLLANCTGSNNQKWVWNRGAPLGPVPKFRLKSQQ